MAKTQAPPLSGKTTDLSKMPAGPAVDVGLGMTGVPDGNTQDEANAAGTNGSPVWPPQGTRDQRTPANIGANPTEGMPGA